jgi:molecular chaperone GrpE
MAQDQRVNEGTQQPDETQRPADQRPADQRPADQRAADERPEREQDERWLRALADLDNARKRFVRDIADARRAERARVAAAFLPVIDNLELALAHGDAAPDAILEGVRAVRDQAIAILSALGYDRRAELGVPFDPAAHEVVAVVDDTDAPPGTVVEVVRPGYGDAHQQLRPVSVAVARQRS